jgi:alkaline phosphatase
MAKGSTPTRVLGIPQVRETLQVKRTARTGFEGAYEVPLTENMPTLEDMTKAALNILHNSGADGFFLMIEGGAVDWACHEHFAGGMIEEQIDFILQ